MKKEYDKNNIYIFMQIILSQKELLKNLGITIKAISNSDPNPILSCVHIKASIEEGIILTAQNRFLEIKALCEGNVFVEGSAIIPAVFFFDAISVCTSEKVKITATNCEDDSSSDKIQIVCGYNYYEIRTIEVDNYPLNWFKQEEEPTTIESTCKKIYEGLKHTSFATKINQPSHVLAGVNLKAKDSSLTISATDGTQIAVNESVIKSPVKKEQNVTIFRDQIKLLEGFLKKSNLEADLTIEFRYASVTFKWENISFNTRRLDSNYPQIHKIFEFEIIGSIVIDRLKLIQAMEALAVLYSQNNSLVTFKFEAITNECVATIKNKELGDGKTSFSCEVDGDDQFLILNSQKLIEALSKFDSKEVIMKIGEINKPVIFEPITDEYKALYLIMSNANRH